MRIYQRHWIAKRRQDYFEGKRCTKCKSTEDLEIDHINRKTKISNSVWSWSKARRNKELKKCQILCYACHKKKTIAEKTKPLIHGTQNAYWHKKCRCPKCKNFLKLWWRKYRKRKIHE